MFRLTLFFKITNIFHFEIKNIYSQFEILCTFYFELNYNSFSIRICPCSISLIYHNELLISMTYFCSRFTISELQNSHVYFL